MFNQPPQTMFSKPTLLILLAFLPAGIFSQGVRGTIVDEQGNPLPNVSIYIPEERTGTITNINGNYEISLPRGEYDLVFQSLGFKQRTFNLTIRDTWIDIDLELEPQSYRLREVVINPSGEDPAYAIMRKAIGMAPYYLRQTREYEAEVYLKGSFRMDKIPKLLKNSFTISVNDNEVPLEEGRTYTMESMNEITFTAPDTFKHTVLASRTSFPAGDESTALGFINSSFYEPDNGMVISPLAPQAMRHYKFRYEGYFDEGNFEINKIKVIPKRKSQQLVSGYVYIVQDLWNLHSVDVTAEMFFGDIRVKQVFQPVSEKAWLPVTHQFDLDIAVMGVKAKVDYSGSVKYKQVKLNEELNIPSLLTSQTTNPEQSEEKKPAEEPQKDKTQQKLKELLTKDELTNREMMKMARLMEKESGEEDEPKSLELTNAYHMDVKKDSLKKDSSYWNAMRPIPLTAIEQESFAIGDSLTKTGTAKKDSAKKTSFFDKVASFSTFGRRFHLADSSVIVDYNGLIGLKNVNFNPVDGWNYKQSLNLRWYQDSIHRMTLIPEVAWAFSRDDVMWNVALSQTYAPLLRGEFDISAGDYTTDFKPHDIEIAPFTDMVASLFFKENYKRYFGQRYLNLQNGIDLANGLRWDISTKYEWLEPMNNNTNYSFFRKDENYYPNIPENNSTDAGAPGKQESFSWRTGLTCTPQYFYRIEKGRKIMSHSKYPTFRLFVEQGTKALDSDANYLLLEGGIEQKKEAGFFPALSWHASGGWFVRNDEMHFSHYKHFNASDIPVRMTDRPAFRLLNDYEASTNEWYAMAHLKYSSPYLLLKNLPVLSNRLWQESLHLDYLHTPQLRNYLQIGYSVDQIFMMGSIGVFAGFEDGHYRHWGISAVLAF